MKILSFIKTKDFLGKRVNFSIDSESNFQTVAGGFLSLFIYLLYIIFFYFLGIDFLLKKNPNSNYQIKDLYESDSLKLININNYSFIFGIRPEDYYGRPVDMEEYIYPKIFLRNKTYYEKEKTFKEFDIELNLLNCSRFQNFIEDNSKSIFNLSEWKCPYFSNNNDFINLGRYWDDRSVLSLKLELQLCPKNSSNDCSNFKALNNNSLKEEKLYVSLNYPEILCNADNYEKFFTFRFKNHWNILSPGVQHNDILYVGYSQFDQDDGFMFESISEQIILGGTNIDTKWEFFNYNNSDISKINYSNKKIYSFIVLLNKYYNYYTRKYMKLQDLLANINGTIDLIIFMFGLLYKIYNKYRLDSYMF